MEMGVGRYGRDEKAEERRARRQSVPTFDELSKAHPLTRMPDGALMPQVLVARGDAGWDGDGDRDSEQAARLAELVRDMDVMCRVVVESHVPGAAFKLAMQWQAIRAITQSNQPTGTTTRDGDKA